VITLTPVTLEGHDVSLEPLTQAHAPDLAAAVSDGRLWELWFTVVPEPEQVEAYIAEALDGAFESLGCQVVGLRTDNFNFASQRAIERLGAKKDGVLRHHRPRRDGTVRDSVIYSILAAEWRDVKRHLELRLARNAE
jgi:hypothetical protein